MKKVEHSESLQNVPQVRDALFAKLVAGGARTYFCGHMHLANHTRLNDTAADPDDKDPGDDFHQMFDFLR